uniref:Reverse transcriptase n=1 Tax=Cannabis sativa TaxID=3483 RepID=A0A803QKL8_CANSA
MKALPFTSPVLWTSMHYSKTSYLTMLKRCHDIAFINTLVGINKLQHWHHATFGQLKEQIKDSHKHVAALHNSSRSDPDHLQAVQSSEQILDELLAKEEDYWHQRSRISWLQLRFQHKVLPPTCRIVKKNNQPKLIDANGNVQTSSQALLAITSDYYQDLFTSNGVDQESLDIILDKIPSVIDHESQMFLSSPFTATDVHSALKTMSDDKSPGLDGLSVMFYTNYWHIRVNKSSRCF